MAPFPSLSLLDISSAAKGDRSCSAILRVLALCFVGPVRSNNVFHRINARMFGGEGDKHVLLHPLLSHAPKSRELLMIMMLRAGLFQTEHHLYDSEKVKKMIYCSGTPCDITNC